MTHEKRTITVAEIRSEFKQLVETAMLEADLTNESGFQLLAALHTAAAEESRLGNSLFLQPVEQLFSEFETGQGADTDRAHNEAGYAEDFDDQAGYDQERYEDLG